MKRMTNIVVILCALYAHSAILAKKTNRHAQPSPAPEQVVSQKPMLSLEKATLLTPQQLLASIQEDLKDPQYREILGNSFYHPLQLLRYGSRTNQSRLFIESTIGLFSKFLKGSPYVNAYVFSGFLGELRPLLKQYFIPPTSGITKLQLDIDMVDRFRQTINSLMLSQFSSEWTSFKENPKNFLDQLSVHIARAAQEEVSIFQLRQALIKFIEVGLSKLVWSPADGMRPWEEVKTMLQHLAGFMEANILDDVNELDELYWTITSRFCYFLETMSTDLPVNFYEQIKQDLDHQPQLLAEIEEQEAFMESKIDYLKRIILTSQAKKRAFDQAGILSS